MGPCGGSAARPGCHETIAISTHRSMQIGRFAIVRCGHLVIIPPPAIPPLRRHYSPRRLRLAEVLDLRPDAIRIALSACRLVGAEQRPEYLSPRGCQFPGQLQFADAAGVISCLT